MENWQYHATYSGTPQDGILSPLLANIYLHKLDQFVMELKANFDRPGKITSTREYCYLNTKMWRLHKRIDIAEGEGRQRLIDEYKQLRAQMLKTPAKSQTDKKLKYVRYADDFLIGVNGSHEDCVEIKHKLTEFIGSTLKMELSDEKTLITHSNQYERFLGYDVRVRRDETVRRRKDNVLQRTFNNSMELNVPLNDKYTSFCSRKVSCGASLSKRRYKWREIMDNTKLKSHMSGKIQDLQRPVEVVVEPVPETSPAPVDSSYIALTDNALEIIKENLKNQPLTVCFFSTWYISYMIGIFCVMYLCMRLVSLKPSKRELGHILARFLGGAVCALGLTAWMWLPTERPLTDTWTRRSITRR